MWKLGVIRLFVSSMSIVFVVRRQRSMPLVVCSTSTVRSWTACHAAKAKKSKSYSSTSADTSATPTSTRSTNCLVSNQQIPTLCPQSTKKIRHLPTPSPTPLIGRTRMASCVMPPSTGGSASSGTCVSAASALAGVATGGLLASASNLQVVQTLRVFRLEELPLVS